MQAAASAAVSASRASLSRRFPSAGSVSGQKISLLKAPSCRSPCWSLSLRSDRPAACSEGSTPSVEIEAAMNDEDGGSAGETLLDPVDVVSLLDEEPSLDPAKDVLDTAAGSHSEAKAKSGAKIHDFCLGIPYGSVLVLGGTLGYILTGSAPAIQLGLLLGGLLLALSFSSLKVWKKGRSSMSQIQGQAAISFLIFFFQAQRAVQAKSLFAGFVALISGAMVVFYSYVFFSGGNPPKKARPVASSFVSRSAFSSRKLTFQPT